MSATNSVKNLRMSRGWTDSACGRRNRSAMSKSEFIIKRELKFHYVVFFLLNDICKTYTNASYDWKNKNAKLLRIAGTRRQWHWTKPRVLFVRKDSQNQSMAIGLQKSHSFARPLFAAAVENVRNTRIHRSIIVTKFCNEQESLSFGCSFNLASICTI